MIELPPFRMWLEKSTAETDTGWVSGWRVDRSECLGGELSVFYGLHVMRGRSRPDAIRLARLYWAVRDAGSCAPGVPFDLHAVPAAMRRDVQPFVWIFDELADATWCEACRSCPRFSTHRLCAWCLAAPIAEMAA
jgi:hypothetical protein